MYQPVSAFLSFLGFAIQSQTFQHCMDEALASAAPEEHFQDLGMVFERLEKYGLVINIAKSQFWVPELDFLGHHVGSTGIRPLIWRRKSERFGSSCNQARNGNYRVPRTRKFLSPLQSSLCRYSSFPLPSQTQPFCPFGMVRPSYISVRCHQGCTGQHHHPRSSRPQHTDVTCLCCAPAVH